MGERFRPTTLLSLLVFVFRPQLSNALQITVYLLMPFHSLSLSRYSPFSRQAEGRQKDTYTLSNVLILFRSAHALCPLPCN